MSNNKNKPEKKNSKGGLIFAGILILLSIMDDMGDDAASIIGVVICIAVFFGICALIGAANKKKKSKSTSSAVNAERKTARKNQTDNIPYKKPEPTTEKAEPARKYYDSDCEQMSTQHDHDRRMEQLDGFLKDGIIGREEYEILKTKYMR